MNDQLAKQIIVEALNLAIQKGCYDLVAVTNIVKALEVITKSQTNETITK